MYQNYMVKLDMPAGYIPKIWLIMRLTTIILIASLMQVSAAGFAQKISMTRENAPLKTVLKDLKTQSGYIFLYTESILKAATPIDINVKDAEFAEVLEKIFEDQPLTYSINEKTITIKEKTPSFLKKFIATIDVRGTVLDEKDQPLPGATVKVKNTNQVVTTDVNGAFQLKNVDEGATLVITYMGYTPKEVKASENLEAIKLEVSISRLDEMQIIAYGISSKRLNTGSVSTVKAVDIEKQPVSNPLATLQGRMSGVIITQKSGVPGSGFDVQIRGQNSVRPEGNAPFYIIDGVPFSSSYTLGGGLGANGSYNPLNSINPADIESIDVLKDADATAIYGSRGANGVVLITTKKGREGTTKLDVNVNSGIGKVSRMMDLLNTEQYLEMRHEAFKNDNAMPRASHYDLTRWDTTRYTDWQKELIGGTAHATDAQVSISGGNSNTQFLVGGGYRRESTVFPGTSADQKASVHFNITNTSINQKFKTLLTGSYVNDNNELPVLDLTPYAIALAPNAPAIYDSAGNLNWENSTWENPLGALRRKYKGNASNLIGNAVLSYEVIPGLLVKTSMGYNKIQMNELRTTPTASFDPVYSYFYKPTSNFADNSINTWIIEPQAEYQALLGKGKISVLIGTTFQQNENKMQALSASGFTSDALLENIQAASSVTVRGSDYIQYRYTAFFGRVNYSLQDKYILNLTGRRDGSSRFGPGKQFSNFGAIGTAWIFSNEDFVKKGLPFLSYGKLRGSYGITGNDQIPDYGYLDLWNSTASPYGGTQGLYPFNLLSPDYAWERNNKLEGGLELGFAKDRILFSASYYRNLSDNQLIGDLLPAITGFPSIQANLPAKVQNTGIELELNTVNVKTNGMTWNTSFNLTIPRNKLLAYPDLALSGDRYQFIVGEPLGVQQSYRSAGVNPQTGIYQYEDSNGQITSSPSFFTDLLSLNNFSPKYYGGLLNSVQYKGLQLDILLQFVKQLGNNYLSGNFRVPGRAFNQPTIVLERWQNPGDNASVQKFTQTFAGAYSAYSNATSYGDNHISDASFIRLKNVSLSYQLANSWKQKLKMQNCRIYMQAQNLFTITNYLGMDPENQSMSTLPPLRMITTGIQFTF